MSEPTNIKASTAGKPLPKRFYKIAALSECDGTFAVTLDGRPARTPAKQPLAVPTRAIGERLVAEWAAQTTSINPATMPLTRLVTTAIDAVTGREALVRDEIVKYAGTDLLCYRAEGPAALVARQTASWDPILTWAERTFGTTFVATQGLMHVTQPQANATKLTAAVARFDALPLAALHTMTTLTGSALLALALAQGTRTLDEVWQSAHIDEDWQIEKWGSDAEAVARRTYRRAEAEAAAFVLASMKAV